MKSLSVLELSKLYGVNRQTIYNHINKGILSKNSENKIDFSEAIRVFGEPNKKLNVKESVKIDSPVSTELLLLRQQIDILKNQLSDAKERESFYQNQIETMQRLLEAPKDSDIAPFIDPNSKDKEPLDQNETVHNNDINISNTNRSLYPNYDVLTTQKHLEEKPKRRGLLGRLAKAVFNN
ncbi:plasmid replication DNA-binding protein [Acinetobacter defluvii]|uniref:plasmid replication DNA-binding protein n=1 Tax=Acinetobacter defluvii TaxID=1871111 RepID=UPI003AF55E13